jgi:hypothetical protein
VAALIGAAAFRSFARKQNENRFLHDCGFPVLDLSCTLVNDDLKILFEILEGDQEVTGRVAIAAPAELREKIARFAAGKCSEEERDQMKKLLRGKPDLIPVLVTEARALRQSDE